MALFAKEQSAPTPLPLSHERILAVLDRREWKYDVDSDGDIGGWWDGHWFYFFREGPAKEILYVRGTWGRKVAPDAKDRLTELVNGWHLERMWPKGIVRVTDDGEVRVHSEHAVDYEFGVTDEQILQHLECAISTGVQLFDHLDEHFPDEAAAARAEQGQS